MSQALATCEDPTLLIDGCAETVELLADQLQARTAVLSSVAEEMARIDVTGLWQGAAGEQLASTVRAMAGRLDATGDAHARASRAMSSYAEEIRAARGRAGAAVDTWQRGRRLTRLASLEHEQAVRRSVADEPALKVPTLVDPGEPLREDAVTILAAAQRMDEQAGEETAVAVESAAAGAPDGGSFWDGVGSFWSDVWHGGWDLGADIGNAIASFANALSEHPDLAVELVGGLALMGVGEVMEAGGVALDLTVVGAPAGIALNITGAGVMVAGAGLSAQAALRLGVEAAGDDAVRPFEGSGSSGGGSGYRSPDAIPDNYPPSVTGYRGHAIERLEERGITRAQVEELVENPVKEPVWQKKQQTWKYESNDLTVIVNEFGEVVSAWIP
ncbi:MAG TPA: DUF4258 domain-containing protein [Cellulomonas sp.]